jgi:hypothetical protein
MIGGKLFAGMAHFVVVGDIDGCLMVCRMKVHRAGDEAVVNLKGEVYGGQWNTKAQLAVVFPNRPYRLVFTLIPSHNHYEDISRNTLLSMHQWTRDSFSLFN